MKNIASTGVNHQTLQSIASHYTGYASPAHLRMVYIFFYVLIENLVVFGQIMSICTILSQKHNGLTLTKRGPAVGCCEHVSEPAGSTEGGEFFDCVTISSPRMILLYSVS